MSSTTISAADAMKQFRSAGIKVQTATPVKTKGDNGKVKNSFKVEDAALSEAHILSAAKRNDGTVAIVTIDGQRHEARGRAAAE